MCTYPACTAASDISPGGNIRRGKQAPQIRKAADQEAVDRARAKREATVSTTPREQEAGASHRGGNDTTGISGEALELSRSLQTSRAEGRAPRGAARRAT